VFRLLIGLSFGLAVSLTLAHAQTLFFPGICDASAAIAIDEHMFIVGDDEKAWLSIYDLRMGELKAKVPLPFGAGSVSTPGGVPEADIEAGAVFEGRIVWISSHGRDKEGKFESDRFQLFASHTIDRRVGAAAVAFSPSFHDLLPIIIGSGDSHYDLLRLAIGDLSRPDRALAPKKRGFNIEGLATTRDGTALLVGMRNPRAQGKAVLFQLNGYAKFLRGEPERPTLGSLTAIDLGDRGIRDIVHSPAHQSYFIIAGQADDDDPGPGFALYRWDGQESSSPEKIDAFSNLSPDLDQFHPEAVVPLLESSADGFVPSKKLLILSDDGSRESPDGRKCKHQPEAKKQFRGIIRLVD
jgi:hypothetical protein